MPIENQPDTSALHGRKLIAAAWLGTGVFSVSALLATFIDAARPAGVVVSLILFGAGCLAFLWAYAQAVQRSRTEEINVGGLYFLSGSAPPLVRRHLLGSTGVQIAVALGTASIRPFTTVAFGILVPMYGLGIAGMWAARYGVFPPRRRLRPKKQRTR